METTVKKKKPGPGTWALWAVLVVVAAGAVTYAALTSGPVTPSPGAATLNPVTIGKQDPNLEFSEADKAEAKAMVTDGRVRKFLQDSHEVWVDPSVWKAAGDQGRRKIVLVFASINRDFDGTRQISVKEFGTDRTVGEYFAGNLRVDP